MFWQELVKIALMGTERAQLSDATKEALMAKGIAPGEDEARIIMEGASYYAMMQKSGFTPKDWIGSIPEPAPQDRAENSCNPIAVDCLQQILGESYSLAIHEFIRLLEQNNKHLPSELLPGLLDQCRQSPDFWKKLQPCIGEKGRWLIQQNPAWRLLLPNNDPTIWETGSREQRRAFLINLRNNDPEEALALINASWDKEDFKSKVEILTILTHKLSIKEEVFLEQALEDRRKEVRLLAAKLLSWIPDSALVERMYQRVTQLFNESKKGGKINLTISLPESLSDDMIRDGINPQNQWYQGGVKASRLGQMIACIPPSIWEKHFKKSPMEILAIFLDSNWGQLAFTALSMATTFHKDEKWMESILLLSLENYQNPDWQNIDIQHMMLEVPVDLFNKFALKGLTENPDSVDNSAPTGILLKELFHPWDDSLTIAFFKTLKNWLKNNPGQYWSAWHFWNILEKAAYLINPALYPTLRKAFDNDPIWHQATEEIDKFLDVLQFRIKMNKALKQ